MMKNLVLTINKNNINLRNASTVLRF